MDRTIRVAMVDSIPSLRRFAVSLAGTQQADDLVQQTLLKACSKIRSFDSRCEILPWLMAILRNQFYSECRRHREVEDVDGAYAQRLVTGPNQVAHTELNDLQAALLKLPDEMRGAVIAVGWEGLSYEDAAEVFHCPIGTIRSRVHRARESLAALLDPPARNGGKNSGTGLPSSQAPLT
jgi:RNA polymerase sigma-70 factor (ECF subfamily)